MSRLWIFSFWLPVVTMASPCPTLLSVLTSQTFRFVGPQNPEITSFALTPDGRATIVSFMSGELARLDLNQDSRTVISFAPLNAFRFLDQTRFVYQQNDSILLYDFGRGQTRGIAKGRPNFVTNGNRIWSFTVDGQSLEQHALGVESRVVARGGDEFWALAVSPGGRRLAAFGGDATIRFTVGPSSGPKLRGKPVTENLNVVLRKERPFLLRWIDDHSLMLGFRNQILWLDANCGEITRALEVEGELLSVSDHGNFGLTRFETEIRILDLRSGSIGAQIPLDPLWATPQIQYLEERKSIWVPTSVGTLTQILLR